MLAKTGNEITREILRLYPLEGLSLTPTVYVRRYLYEYYFNLLEQLDSQPRKSELIALCDQVQQIASHLLSIINNQTGGQ